MEMSEKDRPRYSRVTDAIELLVLMQSRVLGVTISDIERQFNVSRRTAERIRDSIINILPQIDEISVSGREKHWGFTDGYMKEIIGFTPDEIASLESIKARIKYKNEKENLDKVITKLKALSAGKDKNKIMNIEDRIELLLKSEGAAVSQNPNYKIDIDTLNTVREAILSNKKIKAKYNNKEKLLAPYGIIYGSSIYLIGVEGNHENPYVYLLYKFKDVKLTDKTFDKGDFDIKEFSNRSFGVYQNEIIKVELLFTKDVKEDVLNYNFHPTQKVKENYDGTVTVKFKASGPLEIIWHLFKWGNNVKIVSPKNLKDEYIDWLEKCLEAERA